MLTCSHLHLKLSALCNVQVYLVKYPYQLKAAEVAHFGNIAAVAFKAIAGILLFTGKKNQRKA